MYGAWGWGLDDLAAWFHTALRSRPQHPRSPRPVTLNTGAAVYQCSTITQRTLGVTAPPGNFTLPGLDPAATYRIEIAPPSKAPGEPGRSPLAWAEQASPLLMTGAMLGQVGLAAPVQHPGHLVLIKATEAR